MKYKLCPCGHQCKPSLSTCPKCRRNIINIPITDDEANKEEKPPQSEQEESGGFIRICEDCDTKNKSNARKCVNCGEDISYIEPVPTTFSTDSYELVSICGNFKFDIIKPVYIIGRENEFSGYLATKPFASKTHARITILDNRIYLTDTGSTNGTYINNGRIEKNTPVLLNDGDEIGLGGNKNGGNYQEKAAYFKVVAKQRGSITF